MRLDGDSGAEKTRRAWTKPSCRKLWWPRQQRHLMTPAWRQDHAIAFSLYVCARLDPSAGDATAGHSVRTWLLAIGIQLKDGLFRSLLPRNTPAGTSYSATEEPEIAAPRIWLDEITPMELSFKEQRSPTRPRGIANVADAGAANINVSPDTTLAVDTEDTLAADAGITSSDELCAGHLQSLSWYFVCGLSDYALTPMGYIPLEHLRGPAHPEVRLRKGFSCLRRVDIGRFATIWFYAYLICLVVNVALEAAVDSGSIGTLIGDHNPTWIVGVTPDIAKYLQRMVTILAIFAFIAARTYADALNYRRYGVGPLPTHGEGRLEYAMLISLLGAVTLQLSGTAKNKFKTFTASSEPCLDTDSPTPEGFQSATPAYSFTSMPSSPPSAPPFPPYAPQISTFLCQSLQTMWPEYISTVLLACCFCLLIFYEALPAVIHAVVSAWRHGDARMLFETTAHRAAAKLQFV